MKMLATAALAAFLCGCASAPSVQLATGSVSAPSAGDLSDIEGVTPEMEAAAQAYLECGLKAYYTAETPISVDDAHAACTGALRAYRAAYFASFGFGASSNPAFRRNVTPRAKQELAAAISKAGART